jgi:DNA-directed RNA polymerase subunit RPC12/RpoP
VKSFNIKIEHNCPQCGAPADLEETDRLFSCPFCRVRSFLPEKGFFRYLIPCTGSPEKSLVYFPYWRFKGTLVSSGSGGTAFRFIDMSHQAEESKMFPVSLGFRPQALKLRFALPETEGSFVKPKLTATDIHRIAEKRFSAKESGGSAIQSFIGETISIVYSPFFVTDKIIDALLKKPVSSSLPPDFNLDKYKAEKPDWKIDFIPALCPACGWDLSGERDSLVLLCKNCDSAWQPGGDKLIRFDFGHIKSSGDDLTYLPFWKIRAAVSGIDLDSYADLVKLANLPKVVQPGWESAPFCFWIPAFKVRAQHFMRLATSMTLTQPRDELISRAPSGKLHSVNMSLAEAAESFRTVMVGFVKPIKEYLPMIRDIDIKPLESALVYVPFEEDHHDLIQEDYQIALNKALLTTAGNL